MAVPHETQTTHPRNDHGNARPLIDCPSATANPREASDRQPTPARTRVESSDLQPRLPYLVAPHSSTLLFGLWRKTPVRGTRSPWARKTYEHQEDRRRRQGRPANRASIEGGA